MAAAEISPPDPVERILADLTLDEPFERGADVLLIERVGEEPAGLITASIATCPDGKRYLNMHTLLIRPDFRKNPWVAIKLMHKMEEKARGLGVVGILAGVEKALDRRQIVRWLRWWKFQLFRETPTHTWWHRPLRVGNPPEGDSHV